MKPMMIDAKKELLKELIKSMQAKMLEAEESPEMVEEASECGCEEEVPVEGEDDDIDVMQILNAKKPQLPKPKVTISALTARLSQMKPAIKKK